jgi:hypothetical protein
MARLPQLTKLAEQFGLKIISVSDLIAYRPVMKNWSTAWLKPNYLPNTAVYGYCL